MASPLNRLQTTFRTGTQLGRTSLEEASARAGQAVRPTTPVGAAEMGVSPDSAKMAGSSANIAAAQRQALQPSETERLQDILRRRTLAREETKEEKQARGRAAQLGGLTSLQSRVQELMTGQFRDAAAQEAARTPDNAKLATQTNLTGTDLTNLQSILIRYGKGEATNADLRDAANYLGLTPDDDIGAKLNSLLKDTTTEIAEGTAGAVGDRLLVTEDALAQMGYTAAGLGELLGLTPAEVLDLTTDELVGQINALQQKEFSRVAALRRIVNDPNAGPAERQAAQEQLIALGYAGVSATESSVEKLANEIQDANSISIGGRTVTVEEALSDKFISGLVKAYLDDPAGEMADSLRENYPGLISFIEDNKAALKAMTDAMDDSITAFAKIQADVKGLGTSSTGTAINSAYVPDPNEWHDSVPEVPDIVDFVNNEDNIATWGANNISDTVTSMNRLAAIGKEDLLTSATDGDLAASGFYQDSEVYAGYVEAVNAASNPDMSDETFLEQVFGISDMDALNKEIAIMRNYVAAGLLADIDPIIDLLDSNKDGKIDDAATLKKSFLSQYAPDGKPITLKDLVAAKKTVTDLNIGDLASGLAAAKNAYTDGTNDLIQKFGSMFKDGKLDKNELATLESGDTSIEDLQKLADSGIKVGSDSVKSILDKRATAEATSTTQEFLDTINNTIADSLRISGNSWAIQNQAETLTTALSSLMSEYNAAKNNTVRAKIKAIFDQAKTQVSDTLFNAVNLSLQGAEGYFKGELIDFSKDWPPERKLAAVNTMIRLGKKLDGRTAAAARDWKAAYDRKNEYTIILDRIKLQ